MNHADRYGSSGDDIDDLPMLPIPRPSEQSRARTPRPEPIAPPRLGGGASFTAAGAGEHTQSRRSSDSQQDDHNRFDEERLPWDLAARLAQGMLANPGRNQASVKDAMGLFDQLLHEMHAYIRIASEFDLLDSEAERRRNHGAYFRRSTDDTGHVAPDDAPAMARKPVPPPKPMPAQPRPSGSYSPIPPGARTPHSRGSSSPDDEDDSSSSRAA